MLFLSLCLSLSPLVVQLFNAVSKQQKIIEKKAKEAGASERKRSKGQKD
jgi:heme exporter protein D